MEGRYAQSPVDARIRGDIWQMVLIIGCLAGLIGYVFHSILPVLLLLESLLGIFVVRRLWRRQKHLALGYQIEPSALRIMRAWPFKDAIVPFDEVLEIRSGGLESSEYVIRSAGSASRDSMGPSIVTNSATTIPLHEAHQLDYSSPNTFNCLFLEAGILGYYAHPPVKSDIKVHSFVNDTNNMVLLEGPTNYLISPVQPQDFVRDLQSAMGQK